MKKQKTIASSGLRLRTMVKQSLLACARLCSSDVHCLRGTFVLQSGECRTDSGNIPLIEHSNSSIVLMKCGSKIKGTSIDRNRKICFTP